MFNCFVVVVVVVLFFLGGGGGGGTLCSQGWENGCLIRVLNTFYVCVDMFEKDVALIFYMTCLSIHLGAAYADKNVMQKMIEDEVRKQMQEMKIAERRRGAESTPSVKTEPGDDKRVASVTRDLRLGPIEDINPLFSTPGFYVIPWYHRQTSYVYVSKNEVYKGNLPGNYNSEHSRKISL